jgi:hypothetical protein
MGYRYTATDVAMLNSELDNMRANIKRLRTALIPFAKMADQLDEWQKGVGEFEGHFDANDLRRAREVLR